MKTGTTNHTLYFDTTGVQYWPCWCGEHRGEYGLNEWLQHHCSHAAPLVKLQAPDTGDALCMECGKLFKVEPS